MLGLLFIIIKLVECYPCDVWPDDSTCDTLSCGAEVVEVRKIFSNSRCKKNKFLVRPMFDS